MGDNRARMAKQIAAAVKRLRNKSGWTQQQLADQSGVHRTTINKIERGRGDHDHGTIQALADVFGVALGEITGERSADGVGFSKDALRIAEWYDSLDLDDRAFAMKFFEKTFGGGPSRR
jgi:transcriptional regulator with XRE-family HTH domain